MPLQTEEKEKQKEDTEDQVPDRQTFMDIVLEVLRLDDNFGFEGMVFKVGDNENIEEIDPSDSPDNSKNPMRDNRVYVNFERLQYLYNNTDKEMKEIITEEVETKKEIPELERGDKAIVGENPDKNYYTGRNLAEEDFEEGDKVDVVRSENSAHLGSVDPTFVPHPNDYCVLVELNEEGNQRDFFYASDFKGKE